MPAQDLKTVRNLTDEDVLSADDEPSTEEPVRNLTDEPPSDTRQIAGVLGVDHSTVVRDLGGANAPKEEANSEELADDTEPLGANAPEIQNPIAAKRKANEDARKAILETPADHRSQTAPEAEPGRGVARGALQDPFRRTVGARRGQIRQYCRICGVAGAVPPDGRSGQNEWTSIAIRFPGCRPFRRPDIPAEGRCE